MSSIQQGLVCQTSMLDRATKIVEKMNVSYWISEPWLSQVRRIYPEIMEGDNSHKTEGFITVDKELTIEFL